MRQTCMDRPSHRLLVLGSCPTTVGLVLRVACFYPIYTGNQLYPCNLYPASCVAARARSSVPARRSHGLPRSPALGTNITPTQALLSVPCSRSACMRSWRALARPVLPVSRAVRRAGSVSRMSTQYNCQRLVRYNEGPGPCCYHAAARCPRAPHAQQSRVPRTAGSR